MTLTYPGMYPEKVFNKKLGNIELNIFIHKTTRSLPENDFRITYKNIIGQDYTSPRCC